MRTAKSRESKEKREALPDASSTGPLAESAEPRPWEEIERGRYQPRRIRGSCRGRELG